MIYWVLLILLLALCNINSYSICINKVNNKTISFQGKNIYIAIAAFILVLVAGLRGSSVGMDTEMYRRLYQFVKESSSVNVVLNSWQSGNTEIGYVIFEFIISRFADYQFFLMISAVISIVPVLIVIYNYSKNIWFSLFLYISFGLYTFCFTGLRQAIAMGLCMLAFIFSNKKKLVPYLIFAVLAIFFHRSAAVFFPIYWLKNVRINKYTIGLYLLLLALSNIFKNQIFSIINLLSRQQYVSSDDSGGIKMYILMLGIMFLIYLYRKQYFKTYNSDINETILVLFSISTIIWPISSANAAVFRLYYYYFIFIVLLLPNLISSIEKKSNKVVYFFLFIIVGIVLLQFYVVWSSLKFEPYYFFWQ